MRGELPGRQLRLLLLQRKTRTRSLDSDKRHASGPILCVWARSVGRGQAARTIEAAQ